MSSWHGLKWDRERIKNRKLDIEHAGLTDIALNCK